jgi:hypothetical protein
MSPHAPRAPAARRPASAALTAARARGGAVLPQPRGEVGAGARRARRDRPALLAYPVRPRPPLKPPALKPPALSPCPVSTGGGTRRVQLVRGRGGGGLNPPCTLPRDARHPSARRPPPAARSPAADARGAQVHGGAREQGGGGRHAPQGARGCGLLPRPRGRHWRVAGGDRHARGGRQGCGPRRSPQGEAPGAPGPPGDAGAPAPVHARPPARPTRPAPAPPRARCCRARCCRARCCRARRLMRAARAGARPAAADALAKARAAVDPTLAKARAAAEPARALAAAHAQLLLACALLLWPVPVLLLSGGALGKAAAPPATPSKGGKPAGSSTPKSVPPRPASRAAGPRAAAVPSPPRCDPGPRPITRRCDPGPLCSPPVLTAPATPRGQPLPDPKDIPGVGDALKAIDQALCPAQPLGPPRTRRWAANTGAGTRLRPALCHEAVLHVRCCVRCVSEGR